MDVSFIEWVYRVSVGAVLLTIVLMGVFLILRGRDPRRAVHDLERFRERLQKADILDENVSLKDENELLTNWQVINQRLQASCPPSFFFGAACGAIAAGASLFLELPFSWAFVPIALMSVAGMFGYIAVVDVRAAAGGDALGAPTSIVNANGIHVTSLRPLLAPSIGSLAILYSIAVQWLYVSRALPMEPYFVDDSVISDVLKRMPALIVVVPLIASVVLVTAEVFARRTVSPPQPTLSHVPYLQYRTLRVWLGQRFAMIAFFEAFIVPLFVNIYLGNLAHAFASPYAEVVSGSGYVLTGIGIIVGLIAMSKTL